MLDPYAKGVEDAPVKALRFNEGKPKLSMLFEMPDALTGVAKVLEFGAEKYGRANFLHGLNITEVVDSMTRHTVHLVSGEDLDSESGLPHVDHIACNALFLAQFFRSHPDFDDRSDINTYKIKLAGKYAER